MEIEYNFKNCLVRKNELKRLGKKMSPELGRLKYPVMQKINDSRASLHLPYDVHLLERMKSAVAEKKALRPEIIVLVGIGGSNLGVMAVEDFVLDKYKSHIDGTPKLLYADSVDTESINFIRKAMERELANGKNILLNVISKSGLTLETIANFEILLHTLQTYKKNCNDFIVVATEKESLLWNWAVEQKIMCLDIPEYVPGRFSVFSAAGLFPLGLIGVKIEDIFKGARIMHKRCLENDIFRNPAMLSAAIHYFYFKKKVNISNLFLFGSSLENLGKWQRQIMAESLGKEKNLNGKKINAGITPIVSMGTADLHSMEQLFIAGPNDKLTTFVSAREQKSEVLMPPVSKTSLAGYLQGFNLNQIIHYILCGVEETYAKNKRPFINVEMPDFSESSIGQFMMWKIAETVFLAHLLKVNAFDQPAVESYKKATRELMAKNVLVGEGKPL